jgi:hypothetical protein
MTDPLHPLHRSFDAAMCSSTHAKMIHGGRLIPERVLAMLDAFYCSRDDSAPSSSFRSLSSLAYDKA